MKTTPNQSVHLCSPLITKNTPFEWLVKVASLFAISLLVIQATYNAFTDAPGAWQLIATISAIVLIEGALLISWLMIDAQRLAPLSTRLGSFSVMSIALGTVLLITGLFPTVTSLWINAAFLACIFFRCAHYLNLGEAFRTQFPEEKEPTPDVYWKEKQWHSARRTNVLALKRSMQEAHMKRKLDHMTERAVMNQKHQEAMREVKVFKEHLIERAVTNHHLSMAQHAFRWVKLADVPKQNTTQANTSWRRSIENNPTHRNSPDRDRVSATANPQ